MTPTNMPAKLDLLTLMSAIATAEGFWVDGSVPQRNNNPGDLDFASQTGAVASGRFAQFDSVGRGIAASLRQILKDIQSGATLRTLIYTWAPPSDGNATATYLAETMRRIQSASGLVIDPDRKLWEYLVLEKID